MVEWWYSIFYGVVHFGSCLLIQNSFCCQGNYLCYMVPTDATCSYWWVRLLQIVWKLLLYLKVILLLVQFYSAAENFRSAATLLTLLLENFTLLLHTAAWVFDSAAVRNLIYCCVLIICEQWGEVRMFDWFWFTHTRRFLVYLFVKDLWLVLIA